MKAKWYFSTLLILILLGIGQQQLAAPNQEIVLQFSNQDVSSVQSQLTISLLKEQLHKIGVDNINVFEEANGKLKITYYSAIDVIHVKKIFLEETLLGLNISSQKEKSNSEHQNSYDFDVFEIKNTSESQWDLEGTFVAELKADADRYHNPKVLNSVLKEQTTYIRKATSGKIHFIFAIIDSETSCKIPDVRAGPLA